MKYLFLPRLFVISMLLTGCIGNKMGLDSGLFTGEPCKAPCWNNLTPGRSTIDDVNNFLSTLSTKEWPDRKTIIAREPECKFIHLTDNTASEKVNMVVNLYIENNILVSVTSSTPGMTTLKHVVNQFGYPEYVKALLARGPDGEYYSLEIYYPSKGLAFELLPDQQKDIGYITENLKIFSTQYYIPGDIESFFVQKYSCSFGPDKAIVYAQRDITQHLQPWTGFGEIEYKTSP